ncbi:MAG: CBS domain-containing protein [Thioalkalivibrio sp.]|nr:CBS domain-containing protein [Thioalkalivibrio sp.]
MNESRKQGEGMRSETQIGLADDDIRAAMAEIPGYLDISMGDFRELYQHAFRHALERLSECATAGQMMLPATWTVGPDMLLEAVVQGMATRALKGLPVVDQARRVVGVLTETDLLRHFGVITFTQFLDRYLKDPDTLGHTLHETTVAAIMTAPAITVEADARFGRIVERFHLRAANRLPVVDGNGVLMGVLSRKDFIHAFHLEGLL